jgi:hypothetical protein
MKAAILALAVLLLASVSAAFAGIVIHDGQPGIVAYVGGSNGGYVLDTLGRVWDGSGSGPWIRRPDLDVPVPIDSLRFWEVWSLVLESNEQLRLDSPSGIWVSGGSWPPASAAPESASAAISTSPKTIPNPSAGSCRVAFQTAAVGPVSVHVFDASGRLVRRLQDGPLPAGEFSLSWDGRDDGGQDLPSGVYLAKIEAANGTATAKITLTR